MDGWMVDGEWIDGLMHGRWMVGGGWWVAGWREGYAGIWRWVDKGREPMRVQGGIKKSLFASSDHSPASFRTSFSSAGPLNRKRGRPSPSSWTCWRNCQSATGASPTPDTSGSLQSRSSPSASPHGLPFAPLPDSSPTVQSPAQPPSPRAPGVLWDPGPESACDAQQAASWSPVKAMPIEWGTTWRGGTQIRQAPCYVLRDPHPPPGPT